MPRRMTLFPLQQIPKQYSQIREQDVVKHSGIHGSNRGITKLKYSNCDISSNEQQVSQMIEQKQKFTSHHDTQQQMSEMNTQKQKHYVTQNNDDDLVGVQVDKLQKKQKVWTNYYDTETVMPVLSPQRDRHVGVKNQQIQSKARQRILKQQGNLIVQQTSCDSPTYCVQLFKMMPYGDQEYHVSFHIQRNQYIEPQMTYQNTSERSLSEREKWMIKIIRQELGKPQYADKNDDDVLLPIKSNYCSPGGARKCRMLPSNPVNNSVVGGFTGRADCHDDESLLPTKSVGVVPHSKRRMLPNTPTKKAVTEEQGDVCYDEGNSYGRQQALISLPVRKKTDWKNNN